MSVEYVDEVFGICVECEAEVPVHQGEHVVVGVTRVDHMIVSEDTEFVCRECIEAAEETNTDRMIERYKERRGL